MFVLQRFVGGVSAQLIRRIQYATYSTSVRGARLTATAATQKQGDISLQDSGERESSTSGDDHSDLNAKRPKSILIEIN